MNITIDLILPPIIIALLIGMIFSSNILIMESTVENRINNDLQFTANDIITVIQEEVRGIREVIELEEERFRFINFDYDTVSIEQSGREMVLNKTSIHGTIKPPEIYAGRLSELKFEAPAPGMGSPTILRINIITESRQVEEAGERTTRLKAVAQRDIFLNNLHLN